MTNKRTWEHAYNDVLTWAQAFPVQAHTLTLSNHLVGPRRYELRLCVRDSLGQVLVAANGFRASRYLSGDIEFFICDQLCRELGIAPGRCRTSGEPTTVTPTYPLFAGDPVDWHTEACASTLPADVLAAKPERDWVWAYNQVLRWGKSNPDRAHTLSISNHQLGQHNYEIRLCVRDKDGEILTAAHGTRALPQLPKLIQASFETGLAKPLGIDPANCRTVPGLAPSNPPYPLLHSDSPDWQTQTSGGPSPAIALGQPRASQMC